MTWQFDVNNPATTASDGIGAAWRGLADLLVANSWVIQGSGDGDAIFQNTGDTGGPYDVHTAAAAAWGATTPNTFNNPEAWIRIKEPGASTREFVFQRGPSVAATNESYIKVVVAPGGFDNTGVADANTPPTASGDSQVVYDASWGLYNVDIRWHVGCNDAAVNGAYGWYIFCSQQSNQTVQGFACYEPVNNIVVGDPEPWVAYAVSIIPSYALLSNNTLGPKGYRDFGGGAEQFATMAAHGIEAENQVLMPGLGAQADGDERHIAPLYGNLSIAAFKGSGANFRWRGTARGYPNTIDLAGADPRIYVGDITLPWLQNEVPL